MSLLVWLVASACVGAALLLLVRRRTAAPALPLADAGALVHGSRRPASLQAVLVAGVVVALLVLVAQARARTGRPPLLRSGSDAVVVVDLSSSTRSASSAIARALHGLAADPKRKLGLILFSTTAYVALPPSTPADAFAGWVERFAHARPGATAWSSFSSGTTISSGLVLARRVLLRTRAVHPHVVLVSDLVDPPSDLQRVETTLAQYQRDGIDLKVVRLRAHPGAVASAFTLPNATAVERIASTTVTAGAGRSAGDGRIVLAALLGLVAVLAAVLELGFHPFTWGARA